MKRLAYVLPLLIFLGLTAFFMKGLTLNPREVPSPLINKDIPVFELPALRNGDKSLTQDDLKGRVTLVNFFASWCGPCKIEHPLLMAQAKQKTINLVGINYKDKPEDALAWLKRLGDPYSRIAADRDGRIAIDWGVYGVPESYLLDKEGKIRYKKVGPLNAEDLEKTVLPLVKELSK